MRVLMAIALMLSWPATAPARCYSVWHYPWPQRCDAGASRVVAARTPAREDARLLPPPLPPPAPSRFDFVPPTIEEPPEGWTEEALRAFAIQKLKDIMRK